MLSSRTIPIVIVLIATAVVAAQPPVEVCRSDEERPTLDRSIRGSEMFLPPLIFSVGESPIDVAVDDLDLDGRPDIVTSNWSSRDVTVLLGNGDGTFAAGVESSAPPLPRAVAVGDFNLDGWPDLASANRHTANSLTVLLGKGDGTFDVGETLPVGANPGSVAVGDFDQDGRDDVVTANGFSSDLTVLLGKGDGTFNDGVSYAVSSGPVSVAVGDFDQNGWPDLVTSVNNDDCVTILLGRGDGTFASGVCYTVDPGPTSIAVGDFNRDGWADVVTQSSDALNVTVLLGRGDGTLSEGLTTRATRRPKSLTVNDFDRDGLPDLVTVNSLSNNLTVLRGRGDGTFTVGEAFLRYSGYGLHRIISGDFNLDGWVDLAVVATDWDTVLVLNHRGPRLAVDMDIKPGSFPNSLNPGSHGVIPVAILGTETFDVTDVDVTTLAFGPDGAPTAHRNGHVQDVDYDGLMDLVAHFRTDETGIACGDESARLIGETADGQHFEGEDSIKTVGCRARGRPITRHDAREGAPSHHTPLKALQKPERR